MMIVFLLSVYSVLFISFQRKRGRDLSDPITVIANSGCPAGLEKIEKIEKIEKGSFAAVGLEKA